MASTLPVDFFGRVAYILHNYSASRGRGVLNTMIIAVLATLAGCVIGRTSLFLHRFSLLRLYGRVRAFFVVRPQKESAFPPISQPPPRGY